MPWNTKLITVMTCDLFTEGAQGIFESELNLSPIPLFQNLKVEKPGKLV